MSNPDSPKANNTRRLISEQSGLSPKQIRAIEKRFAVKLKAIAIEHDVSVDDLIQAVADWFDSNS